MKTKTIQYGSEYMTLHPDGCITRPEIGMNTPSGQWRVTGAVRFNNFGRPVERFTLADILAGKIAWKHKNGSQRVHVTDLDHGTNRTWMSPSHSIS
jgi:hypothetical protein